MWPKILWHFVDKDNKAFSNKQYETLRKILGNDSENMNIKLSTPSDDDLAGYVSVGFLSLTSLPKETKNTHSRKYGKFALGFNRSKLVRLCKDKGYYINPIFYAFKDKSGEIALPFVDLVRRTNCSLDGMNVRTDDALYYLRIFTKVILDDDEDYNYFLEQEWRLVVDATADKNLTFPERQICFGKPVTSSFNEESIFFSLPSDCLDFIVTPNDEMREQLVRDYPVWKNKVILFDEIK